MTLIESRELIIETKNNKAIPAMIDGEIVSLTLPCQLKIEPRALRVLKVALSSTRKKYHLPHPASPKVKDLVARMMRQGAL